METPKTPTQRILALFEGLWPTDRWYLKMDHTETTASVEVRSPDQRVTYARVFFTKEGREAGFALLVSYPSFWGKVEEMDDPAGVVATLVPVLRKMVETALIRTGS